MVIAQARAVIRLAALTSLTLSLLVAYGLVSPLGARARRRIVRTWHRAASRIVGIRIRAHGSIAREGSLLVANHVSYLDVLALGAQSEAAFVAKADVAGWPVIGFLARLANTLFIERAAAQSHAQIQAVQGILASGQSAIVFPEGTSSTGRTVLPFKSTLFEAAKSGGNTPAVQPVTIAYAKDAAGWDLPIDQRCIHPWIGEDSLVPHLWTLLQHPGATADVIFHAPVAARDFASRKQLAEYCRDMSARGLVMARRREALPVCDKAETVLQSPVFGLLR